MMTMMTVILTKKFWLKSNLWTFITGTRRMLISFLSYFLGSCYRHIEHQNIWMNDSDLTSWLMVIGWKCKGRFSLDGPENTTPCPEKLRQCVLLSWRFQEEHLSTGFDACEVRKSQSKTADICLLLILIANYQWTSDFLSWQTIGIYLQITKDI